MTQATKLSFSTAVMMSLNIMIGAGLYAGVGKMAAIAGHASFLGWGIVALLYLPIVYAISRLAVLIPQSGGFYRYAHEAFGRHIGFLNGWLYFLAYLCTTAAVMGMFRELLLVQFPSCLLVTNSLLFSAIMVGIITFLNLLNMNLLGRIQSSLTIAKILPIIILFLLLPFFLGKGLHISTGELVNSFSSANWTMALFGLFGFEFACMMTQQIEDGERNTPRIVFVAFALVTAIYTLFSFGLLQVMGADNLVAFGAIGYPQFIGSLFPWLVSPLTLIITLSMFILFINGCTGLLTVSIAQIESMANSNILRGSTFLSKRNTAGRPLVLTLIISSCVFLLGALIPTSVLTLTTTVGVIGTYGLCSLALAVLQRRKSMVDFSVAIVGFAIATVLTVSQLMLAGGSLASRFVALLPILIGLTIGFILLQKEETKPWTNPGDYNI